MSTRRGHFRLRFITAAGAVALCGAMVASAGAVVDIYSNSFNTKPKYREIKPMGKPAACDRDFKAKDQSMAVRVRKAPRTCWFRPPVQGSGPRPDHRIDADGRILAKTPKAIRGEAFVAVSLRVGGGRRYELRVFPKGKRFELRRRPNGAGFPQVGTHADIKGIGAINKLRLIALNDKIRGVVNGTEVADVTDPNDGQVQGTKLQFGVGSDADSPKNTEGSITRVKVAIP